MDVRSFPEMGVIHRAYAASYQHYKWCKNQAALNLSPWLPWDAWLPEAEHCYECWNALYDAHIGNWPDRETHLRKLRNLLGGRAYYRGEMPIPIYMHHIDESEELPDGN